MKMKQFKDAGTTSQFSVGTAEGNVVQLDSSGKIPEMDGSNLTGLTGGSGSSDPASYTFVEVTSTSDYTISDSSNNGTVYYFSNASAHTNVFLPQASVVGEGFFVMISARYRAYIKPKSGSSDSIPYYTATLQDNFRIDTCDAATFVSGGSSNLWHIIFQGTL